MSILMREKILIVDDDSSVRRAFAEFLKNAGFSVAEAAGGKEALSAFTNDSHPDLVLLDLIMPEMGGLAFLGEVRKIAPDVPIIFISGYGDVSTAVEAIKMGAYDYMVKPPDFDHLLLIIERALDKSRLMQKIRDIEDNQDLFLQKLLGTCSALKNVIADIKRVASSDLSLIMNPLPGLKTGVSGLWHNLTCPLLFLFLYIFSHYCFLYFTYCFGKIAVCPEAVSPQKFFQLWELRSDHLAGSAF